jgi:hypothetical protein
MRLPGFKHPRFAIGIAEDQEPAMPLREGRRRDDGSDRVQGGPGMTLKRSSRAEGEGSVALSSRFLGLFEPSPAKTTPGQAE